MRAVRWGGLAALVCAPVLAAGLGDADRILIDAYLTRAGSAASATTTGPSADLKALGDRVAALFAPNDVDYAAWTRLDSFLDGRIKDIRKNARVNVYQDEAWLHAIPHSLAELCCMIRTTPRLAADIRDRVKRGQRALPFGMQKNETLAAAIAKSKASRK